MIIIPDVHGRTFWKEAVRNHETDDIIFLGDYLDPYSREGITRQDAIDTFLEIIAFKQAHPDNVTLLLGNHDLGYICSDINDCRRDYEHYDEIHQLFHTHRHLFQLCTSRQIQNKTYFFSHAFLNYYWLETCRKYLDFKYDDPSQIADILNTCYRQQQSRMFELLSVTSTHRGGVFPFGSMVWSDLHELDLPTPFVDGIYNVFGHTQLRQPFIQDTFACLDTRHAYRLNPDASFTELGN